MAKKRIVVKIGSSSLTDDKGEIDLDKFTDHVRALANLHADKHDIVVVSSGAVAAGFKKLGYSSRPVTIKGKQAAAAVGQSLLIQSYIQHFSKYGIVPAQILLTRSDFLDRDRYRNAFTTITELLDRGLIPIINENDTIALDELTFGDNDMLSALVSGFIHADQLIILTDINGLYTANPKKDSTAQKIDFLEEITGKMLEAAGDSGSKVGTGGMKSKLLAAKRATSLGVSVFIGHGEGADKLINILKGEGDGTYIASHTEGAINTKRQWIALHSESVGKLYIDPGAEEAIMFKGKSLLPAGIFKVSGTFQKGDVVEVHGMNGLLGKGEVSCSSDEVMEKMMSRNQEKTNVLTGEVIHRDRWVKKINV